MAYSEKIKEKALREFIKGKSFNAISKIKDMPNKLTIIRWHKKYNWEQIKTKSIKKCNINDIEMKQSKIIEKAKQEEVLEIKEREAEVFPIIETKKRMIENLLISTDNAIKNIIPETTKDIKMNIESMVKLEESIKVKDTKRINITVILEDFEEYKGENEIECRDYKRLSGE